MARTFPLTLAFLVGLLGRGSTTPCGNCHNYPDWKIAKYADTSCLEFVGNQDGYLSNDLQARCDSTDWFGGKPLYYPLPNDTDAASPTPDWPEQYTRTLQFSTCSKKSASFSVFAESSVLESRRYVNETTGVEAFSWAVAAPTCPAESAVATYMVDALDTCIPELRIKVKCPEATNGGRAMRPLGGVVAGLGFIIALT